MKRNNVILLGLLLAILTLAVGCQTKTPTRPPSAGPHLEVATSITKAVAEALPVRAAAIDQHTDAIVTKIPTETQAEVASDVAVIKGETAGMRADADRLQEGVVQIAAGKAASDAQQTAYENLAADNAKLKQEQDSGLNMITGILVAVGVLGFAGAVFLMWMGKPIGAGVGVAAVALIASSILVRRYQLQLAIGAGSLFVVVIVIFFRNYIVEQREKKRLQREKDEIEKKLADEQKATKELVQTVEVAKKVMPEFAREQVFGNPAMPTAAEVQTDSTKALVAEARKDMVLVPPIVTPVTPTP